MALLAPQVKGPLSVCNSHIRVQGQLTGSTVNLFANGVHVGSGVASSADQVFSLNAGVTLAAGDLITATQTLGGQVSPPSPLAVQVQQLPPALGSVGCQTHIYECGQCVWLDGILPGATVEVTVLGVSRGSGRADDGTARFGLTLPTGPGDILNAQQTGCGLPPGPLTPFPPADPVPTLPHERLLPLPTVESPLKACMRSVTVSNVIDGAQVILIQTAAPTEHGCFDRSSLWFPTPPLVAGETVLATQEFPDCNFTSLNSKGVVVGPATPVPPPMVVPPLCADSTTVQLTGLLPGSQVRIFQDGVDLGTGQAPDTSFAFAVPPLAANSVVTARQELCNNWSDCSNEVKVDPQPASISPPVIQGPLYQCGAVVRVTNIHPGSQVSVYSNLGQISPWQQVNATQTDIPVAPQLIAGERVFAKQSGCGLQSQSAAVIVRHLVNPSLPQVQEPVEDWMRSVTVTQVLPGARVDVYVNGSWRGTAIAGAATVEVPIFFGPLHVNDEVRARQWICVDRTELGDAVFVVSHLPYYYLTQHFENARTGWNPYETTLTAANVPLLKQLFTQKVDAHVYAQPLYAHHVLIPGQDAHNVVYVATEKDTVYAFDADTDQPVLWQRSLLPCGETYVSNDDVAEGTDPCNDVRPDIGITSTPVIDLTTYTMYVVAKTKRVQGRRTNYHQYLYAIDIATGNDRPGSPQEIQASFPGMGQRNDGHGHVLFLAQWQMNRPGLLLHNGVVYIAFASHCDHNINEYHGWILAYDAATLNQIGTFCTSPDNSASGIWQGGMGLAVDPAGSIYCTTGNGLFDASSPTYGRDYGDSVLRLRPDLTEADYFTPSNQNLLLIRDIDLGSGGVLVLPDLSVRPVGLPNLLVTCGKDGYIYLLNRNNLGGFNGPNSPVQRPPLQLQPGKIPTDLPGVWGGPAYYHGPNGEFVYYCGNGGPLTAFQLQNALLSLSTQSPAPLPGQNGVTPTVSSNQQLPGTGVVWAIAHDNPLRLQAYDATNLTINLFDQPTGQWNSGTPMIEPTVIQGKVYAGSDGQLTVFGL